MKGKREFPHETPKVCRFLAVLTRRDALLYKVKRQLANPNRPHGERNEADLGDFKEVL